MTKFEIRINDSNGVAGAGSNSLYMFNNSLDKQEGSGKLGGMERKPKV